MRVFLSILIVMCLGTSLSAQTKQPTKIEHYFRDPRINDFPSKPLYELHIEWSEDGIPLKAVNIDETAGDTFFTVSTDFIFKPQALLNFQNKLKLPNWQPQLVEKYCSDPTSWCPSSREIYDYDSLGM